MLLGMGFSVMELTCPTRAIGLNSNRDDLFDKLNDTELVVADVRISADIRTTRSCGQAC
jgi:hypothetical protein